MIVLHNGVKEVKHAPVVEQILNLFIEIINTI